MIVIGIDPGVHTGLAICRDGELIRCASPAPGIIEAMEIVTKLAHSEPGRVLVVFEDARLIGGINGAQRGSKADRARLQGAGSVKRDCAIWAELLGRLGVPYISVSPRDKGAKLSAAQFEALTGWTSASNEHSRDAGVLAWRYRNQRTAFASRAK